MLFLVHVNNSYNFHTNWDHLKYELRAVSISKLGKESSQGDKDTIIKINIKKSIHQGVFKDKEEKGVPI